MEFGDFLKLVGIGLVLAVAVVILILCVQCFNDKAEDVTTTIEQTKLECWVEFDTDDWSTDGSMAYVEASVYVKSVGRTEIDYIDFDINMFQDGIELYELNTYFQESLPYDRDGFTIVNNDGTTTKKYKIKKDQTVRVCTLLYVLRPDQVDQISVSVKTTSINNSKLPTQLDETFNFQQGIVRPEASLPILPVSALPNNKQVVEWLQTNAILPFIAKNRLRMASFATNTTKKNTNIKTHFAALTYMQGAFVFYKNFFVQLHRKIPLAKQR